MVAWLVPTVLCRATTDAVDVSASARLLMTIDAAVVQAVLFTGGLREAGCGTARKARDPARRGVRTGDVAVVRAFEIARRVWTTLIDTSAVVA